MKKIMETKQEANTGSDAPTCSPSSDTPETDGRTYDPASHAGGWRSFNPDGICVDSDFARRLERERNELAGYLCRIKLPLPIRFVADLATLFPGKNVRMKDVDGYLCIFSENDQGHPARSK